MNSQAAITIKTIIYIFNIIRQETFLNLILYIECINLNMHKIIKSRNGRVSALD